MNIDPNTQVTIEVSNQSPISPIQFWIYYNLPDNSNVWSPLQDDALFLATGQNQQVNISPSDINIASFPNGIKFGWLVIIHGTQPTWNQPYDVSIRILQSGIDLATPWNKQGAFQGQGTTIKGTFN